VDSPDNDARVLLAHVLDCSLNDVLLRSRECPATEQAAAYQHLLDLRASRMPLQYVTGNTVFCGLTLRTDRRALVPRQETELLAEAVAKHLGTLPLPADAIVVDVGCGSGAIALALAHWLPDARVLATDISPAALELAMGNARLLGLAERVEFALGDCLEPVLRLGLAQRVVAVVNNPPYVKPEEMPLLDPETLAEPRVAVQSRSEDGLLEYRQLAREARALPNLRLLGVEVGFGQAEGVRAILGELGSMETLLDYCDIERHVIVRVGR
jgi:release factor glutamine methyltransferase